MKKEAKKVAEKKPDEKQKVNFEEMIFSNLSNFKLTYDSTGYHFT